MNFENIQYLATGNIRQQNAYKVLNEYSVFDLLKKFQPILTGTIPINIDIESSDLDIICYWIDQKEFAEHLQKSFSKNTNFELVEKEIKGVQTVIARFQLGAFKLEIFGQNIPSREQHAYRHMLIEHKLLEKHGENFRQQIIQLKRAGIKTEPAFAKVLGIEGDPYESLLHYTL